MQYLELGFNKWADENIDDVDPEDRLIARDAWYEAAQRMESYKDSFYGKMKLSYELDRQKWAREREVRREVHADDYHRAGILISGLKRIIELAELNAVHEMSPIFAEIANETLTEALGKLDNNHRSKRNNNLPRCDQHPNYMAIYPPRADCEVCRMIYQERHGKEDTSQGRGSAQTATSKNKAKEDDSVSLV